jgi:hypothetical protein
MGEPSRNPKCKKENKKKGKKKSDEPEIMYHETLSRQKAIEFRNMLLARITVANFD